MILTPCRECLLENHLVAPDGGVDCGFVDQPPWASFDAGRQEQVECVATAADAGQPFIARWKQYSMDDTTNYVLVHDGQGRLTQWSRHGLEYFGTCAAKIRRADCSSISCPLPGAVVCEESDTVDGGWFPLSELRCDGFTCRRGGDAGTSASGSSGVCYTDGGSELSCFFGR